VPLGGFYLLPLAVAAAFMSRWAIFVLAIGTALISEYYGPYPGGPESLQRLALAIVAFTGGSLFAGELARNRRITVALLRKTQEEARVRLDAVTEMRALLESSPVGLITVDSDGRIGMANTAASRTATIGVCARVRPIRSIHCCAFQTAWFAAGFEFEADQSGGQRTAARGRHLPHKPGSPPMTTSEPRLAVVLSDARAHSRP
jgi:PAS domain-containing protein